MTARPKHPPARAGDGATLLGYSDRHAATVVKVTPFTVTVQQDKDTRIDGNGMSDSQQWEYERDEKGRTITFRRNKHGQYVNRRCGFSLHLGARREFYDFSF